MTNSERAEKIWDDLENRRMGVRIKGIWVARLTQELDEAVREAHYELAQKQANVLGESVMLCGNLVANEELYKQPTDYVKEAYAEGFAQARELAAKAAEIEASEYYDDGCGSAIARSIRAIPLPGETDK